MFEGFKDERDAGEGAGEHRLAPRARLEGTYRERYGHEHRDNGWEVRLLRQAERLRKELVDPRVVVALDEEGDRDEGRYDEGGRAPDPG